MEMKWRKAEEECANKILQDQITELQENLNTHISVCVYDYSFTAHNDETKNFVTVSPYREILIDNSRISGKKTKAKDLLDPEKGMFKVPEEADGEYEFTATISADTYQDTDAPFHRPAYWAIMKEGKEEEAIKEATSTSSYGNKFSAGIMFGDAGNHLKADTISVSKTITLSLKAGEKVHLAAIKKDGYFPFAGYFISFCASLVSKDATNVVSEVHVGKNPSPVFGPRHDCIEKIGEETPLSDTSLSTQLASEDAEALAEAEKDLETAKTSGDADKIKEAEDKKAAIEEEQKSNKKKDCDVKKKAKEGKEKRRKKENEKKEEEKQQEKCKKEKLDRQKEALQEEKGEGEKKWYIDDDCETNKTVILLKECCSDDITEEREKIEQELNDNNDDTKILCPKEFMTLKQAEMKCEQTKKAKNYNPSTDPMLDREKSVPKCCPIGEECSEAEPRSEEGPEVGSEVEQGTESEVEQKAGEGNNDDECQS
eukprot:GFUD01006214.1.p1 GENE.GFUD01006214.1~~GFUD01006214.1.p1  ORF type:complete len:546 (-),score=180.12 GFUD01006214.1:177-1628(-)